MEWKLIVNPVAGKGFALQAAEMVKAELEKRGESCEVLQTKAPGHATELARAAAMDPNCKAVISVGGDGTAFEVASGLAGTGKNMGIIPAGTGNDFIKSVHIPKDPMAALEFMLAREPRAVDIGRINDRHFLNVCGTGFDVTVLEQMDQNSSSRGMLPYLKGVLRAIACFKPVHVICTLDSGEMIDQEVLICAVANGRFIGGGIGICPDAEPHDGLLDVVIVGKVPRWRVPFYLPGLMLGRILHFKVSRRIRCKAVRVVSPGMRIQIDGEIFSMDEASFSVQPELLQLYW